MWPLVAGGLGTLREIQHEWSVYDLLDALNFLAVRADIAALPPLPSPRHP